MLKKFLSAQLVRKPHGVVVECAFVVREVRQWIGRFLVILAVPFALSVNGDSILREVYQGIGGNTISDLTNATIFPDHPTLTNLVTDFFEAPTDWDDNYGTRMHGYISPPLSGNYTFWIATDDNGSLYLSTDEDPAHIHLIASVSSWTSSRQWDAYPEQKSVPIALESGKNYYILALQKEGGGGDNLAVQWQRPDGVTEGPIPATYLYPYGMTFTPPVIAVQPTNTTGVEGGFASFSVQAKNGGLVHYQWLRDGKTVTNATSSTYTLGPLALSDSGSSFRAVLTNKLGLTNSLSAILTVTPDITRPTIVSTINIGSSSIRVIYSEPVSSTTALNTSNYTVDGGIAVTGAVFDTDNRTVILATSPMQFGTSYTLTIRGIQDRAATPNTIANPTAISFLALEFFSQDIASTGGSIQRVGPGAFNLTGGGADIGGTSDQFQFAWELRTGNFDIQVHVPNLTITDPFVHAGLMARGSLSSNAAFAGIFAASVQEGCFFESRTTPNAPAVNASIPGGYPVNFPLTYLRLRRVGNVFTGFASLDGQQWTQLGTATVPVPSQIYVGLALSADNSNAVAAAQFREYGPVVSTATVNFVRDREPLGPTSRRTGLIFTEIMYHPKQAPGATNHLEFIEINNAGTLFEDLSGWRIKGGISYRFPDGFILPAGAFVAIAADPAALSAATGTTNVLGPFFGKLNNSGDSLTLEDNLGATRLNLSFSASAPWPAAADGAGHSLVLLRPSYGENDPRAWGISEAVGGTPGRMETLLPNPQRGVVINEFLAHTDLPQIDYIELYNHTTATVDLSGCWLTDDPTTNKYRIPDGTVIAAGGFMEFPETQTGFRLNAAGEWIFLVNPDGSRVIDGLRFEAQENGVATGRWPDGASTFRRLAQPTPGAANSRWRSENVVINELMFNPITGDSADEYVELFNRGTNTVDLGGWKFVSGIGYKFAAGTVLAPGGYMVVAKNASHLRSNYSQLSTNNTLGDFSGSLKNSGDRVALSMPDDIVSTNSIGDLVTNKIDIVVSEVSYVGGGRWGVWSNGGGSSMELIDPSADPLRPSNWADSDESQKSTWTNFEVTRRLDNGMDGFPPNRLHITMLNQGEALVDNVEVIPPDGTNLLSNGGFEVGSGTTASGWVFNGNLSTSKIDNTGAYEGNRCLHVRAQGDGDTGVNTLRTVVNPGLNPGDFATIRAKARWVAGWPEVLFKFRGAWLELPARLPVPKNLGTPGLPNSRAVANAGPAIYEVTHTPALPKASGPVVVSCRVSDPDGVASVTLRYRIDPSQSLTSVVMRDDGTGGDAIAGDGIYSATISGRSSGTLAAFRIQAQDANTNGSAIAIFPPLAPAQECLIRWDDSIPDGNFAHYHMWNTQTSENARTNPLNNTYRDATLVYGNFRVIYNAGFRDKGSPFHGGAGSFAVVNLEDDPLLGETDRIFRSTGNGGPEGTGLKNQVSMWIAKQLGIPYLHSHYMRLFRNGALHYNISQDEEAPNRGYASSYFPSSLEADLYKIAFWFEFQDDNTTFGPVGATMEQFLTDGNVYKLARYRWNWQTRGYGGTANNYTNIFNLVTAATDPSDNYVPNLLNLADIDSWMRIFAFNHILGNWDSYSYNEGQNMYIYKRQGQPWAMMPWDIDFVLGDGDSASSGLWGGQDPSINRMFDTPAFRRMLWRTYQEAIAGPLLQENYGPIVQARRSELTKNNVTDLTPPDSVYSFIEQRRTYIAAQIAASDAQQFAITSNGGTGFTSKTPLTTLSGTAPFAVANIEINGTDYPVDWTDFTTFSISVPLTSATNILTLFGKDRFGNPLPGAVATITIKYNGAIPKPQDFLVINEIQYNSIDAGASFVEIYNRSTNTSFDLSGWRVDGLGYTFPGGSVIGTNSYLVLAKDRVAFGNTYGLTLLVFDVFPGSLNNSGEHLKLVEPDPSGGPGLVVDDVRFDDHLPWPLNADGLGPSLQLIDPTQDNWRVGNWAATATNNPSRATPGGPNTPVLQKLAAFPALWLNEVLPNNVAGPLDNNGEKDPFIELYNAGTAPIDLSSYFLSDNYTNLTQWQFPTGTVVAPKSFLVVWADGQPAQSVAGIPHTSFRLNSASGSIALSRKQGSPSLPAVMDYINYNQVSPGRSFGSYPDGEPRTRRAFYYVTAGATNNPAFPEIKVNINEFMAENTTGIKNPYNGKFDDWIELYNGGQSAVDLSSYTFTDNLTNAALFAIPSGYVIQPGGFLLVWADSNPKANSPTNADLHLSFKLAKTGEQLGLFSPDGALVDGFTFGPQTNDVSQGRYPDGDTGSLVDFETPTPRAPNILAGGNRPPSLAPIADQTVVEQTLWTYQAIASDLDSGQNITFSLGANAPDGVSIEPVTGMLTWIPSEIQGPGIFSFSVRATDNGVPARTTAQTVRISVLEANRAPSVNPIPDTTIDELALFSFTAAATDPDFPTNSLGYSLDAGAPTGAAIDPQTGIFTWTPAESQGPGHFPITVRVTDNGTPALSATATFNITVNEVNNPPQIDFIPPLSIDEGSTLSYAVHAADPDSPPAPLLYSLEGNPPPGLSVEPNTGLITWTPTEAQGPGTYIVILRATENNPARLSSAQSFGITVNEVNQAPILGGIPTLIVEEGSPAVTTVTATDADLPGQKLSFSLGAGSPAAANIDPNTGQFTWPTPDGIGHSTNSITVIVTDDGPGRLTATNQLTVITTARFRAVINEIMYQPRATNAQFVEIYNPSVSSPQDLTGFQLSGENLRYIFPPGTLLNPGQYLTVVQNRAAFAAAYGSNIAVLGEWSGKLDRSGTRLRFLGTNSLGKLGPIGEVNYRANLPWPTNADGGGSSLQLVDAHQDTSRVGNWAVSTGPQWTRVVASGTASSSTIYLYLETVGDVYVDDVKLVAGSDPDGGDDLLANGGFESDFPGPFTVSPNMANSAVVSNPTHSGRASLHLVATSPGTTRASAVYQDLATTLTANAPYTISFWYLPSTAPATLTVRLSGSGIRTTVNVVPDAGNKAGYTPGVANSGAATLPEFPPVWINETVPDNVTGITDSRGIYSPWIELVNRGLLPASLDGWFLSHSYTNLTEWHFPAGASIDPGQYLVLFADGQTNASTADEWHTGFRLDPRSGSIVLSRPQLGDIGVVDYLDYAVTASDRAFGRDPADFPGNGKVFASPTPGGPNVIPSSPVLTASVTGTSTVTLSWTTLTGVSYELDYRNSLTNAWKPLSTTIATSTNLTKTVDISSLTQRYYRVTIP